MNYYVGMDLGGTNTKIGLVDEAGNIIFTTIVKTDSMEGFEKTVERRRNPGSACGSADCRCQIERPF